MNSFAILSAQFSEKFNVRHFPASPATLYDPNEYFLSLGGKRVRPVLCLMGNELFDEINSDACHVAPEPHLGTDRDQRVCCGRQLANL